jgi:hypothetical protein
MPFLVTSGDFPPGGNWCGKEEEEEREEGGRI